MENGQTIPYASSKREDDTDNRETILYASPRRDGEDEIDEKNIYIRTLSWKLQQNLKYR